VRVHRGSIEETTPEFLNEDLFLEDGLNTCFSS